LEIRQITDVRQVQTISPQFILTQRLLQLTSIELMQEIEVELSENPVLEMVEVVTCPYCHRPIEGNRCENCGQKPGVGDDGLDQFVKQHSRDYEDERVDYNESDGQWENEMPPDQFATLDGTFQDFLMTGFLSADFPEELRELGEYLIYSIDDNGFLKFDTNEIKEKFKVDERQIMEIVEIIQSLEPVGVGAENPMEALRIQLRALEEEGKGNELAGRMIEEHFEDLGKGRFEKIAESMGIDAATVNRTLEYIRRNLNPFPGRAYTGKLPEFVSLPKPAIAIKYDGQMLTYEILELTSFQLRISKPYLEMYENYQTGGPVSREDISHIREYFRRAKFFLDSIEQRRTTLEKIAQALCEEQKDFLTKGLPHFNASLTQGAMAEKIGLHESTVSRAMSGKYVAVPSGEILSFDFFFDSSVRPKEYIKNIIANEDAGNPVSDSDLRKMLASKGIDIARRTVAKYRESMGIPSSYERRRNDN